MIKHSLIFFILIMICAIGSPVLAEINTSGLTSMQQAETNVLVEKMKEQNRTEAILKKESYWTDLGKNVSQALTASAKEMKELGMDNNAFLESDYGKRTHLFILWKAAKKEFVGLAIGLGMLIFLVPLWTHFFRKMCIIKSITDEYPSNDKFKRITRTEHYGKGEVGEARFGMFVVLLLIFTCSLIIIFCSL